ncbi:MULTISPECIES: quinoprotein dehydrogenase-associated SoxYZ-like carrier [Roseovarius]|uniref:quinoprotein dehydrogenase-associated SoxYZ-like carrier n=1 Tax=Roseovarius TaxID=74030 RepID=UPI00273D08C8|nr:MULTISPECIES: quinoprotein dehydrogenase-associated SoxYZ-like carrier [unclassified Roseovarius]
MIGTSIRALSALCVMAVPALAGTWEDLSAEMYGERALLDGTEVIAIDAPYRTGNDARTQLAAQVVAPEGAEIASVTLVIDENPMPVSAVFDLDAPLPAFFFDVTMRINGPTPMHVVAETTDGRLFVSEAFVKTSGQGACAAPPGTDPKLALETLGQVEIELAGQLTGLGQSAADKLANRLNRMDVDISHPSHSGMQMDQITLLFLPMRYVETVEIDLDGAGYVEMTGSISLSENPQVALSVPSRAQAVDVTMTDTDGTVTHAHKKLTGY